MSSDLCGAIPVKSGLSDIHFLDCLKNNIVKSGNSVEKLNSSAPST